MDNYRLQNVFGVVSPSVLPTIAALMHTRYTLSGLSTAGAEGRCAPKKIAKNEVLT